MTSQRSPNAAASMLALRDTPSERRASLPRGPATSSSTLRRRRPRRQQAKATKSAAKSTSQSLRYRSRSRSRRKEKEKEKDNHLRKDLVIPTLYVDEPVVVASTGFRGSDNEDLEFIPASIELICELYGKGVYKGKVSVLGSSLSSSSSSSSSRRNKGGSSKAMGRNAKLDVSCISTEAKGDDDVEGNFEATMLVLPEELQTKIRTFRVLFALARGLPIVTERWVHDSLERGTISEWFAFRAQRYKHLPLFEPSNIMARCRIFVGNVNKKISLALVKQLCELVGGKVVEDISQCTMALFGTRRTTLCGRRTAPLYRTRWPRAR